MLVQRFSEIFSDRPGDTNLAEHRIDLTSDVPVRQTPYAVPFALKSSLKKELQQMEDLGIIRRSDSPYASPVVVVKKKDGSNRICIDSRRLNKITVTDPQPVPSPTESFLGMSEDKYFSKLVLTKGYHQIRGLQMSTRLLSWRWVNTMSSCGCRLGWLTPVWPWQEQCDDFWREWTT